MDDPDKIYDDLLRFESRNKNTEPYPVHKKLRFPTGKYRDLLDKLSAEICLSKDDHILDAGCGTGYTLFYLHEHFGVKGIGISICRAEIQYAQKACLNKGLKNSLSFKQEDYQRLNSGQFSKIFCIESLKHASDLKKGMINLINKLIPGGQMIIVDDFIKNRIHGFKQHKRYWSAPSFTDLETYTEFLEKSGPYLYRTIDLTPFVIARSVWKLNLLYFVFSILRLFAFGGYKRNILTYLGGLILEKGYAKRKVKYMIIIIENKKL